ncbi:MAG: ABC transporter permease [Candidatus Azobacteroides sp.]|nr:ABC transporter permease [Candidatus Azobacteroides sp.]
MNLSLFIARRYLFSKKSHNAINLISGVSVCGVAVATMALICTLSVFNGFQSLISGLFSRIDPQLTIVPAKGKVFDTNNDSIQNVLKFNEIALFSYTLEDNALVKYKDKQVVAKVKGVDENYSRLTDINESIVEGKFQLKDSVADYAIPGAGLAGMLGVRAGFFDPVEIYAPNRTAKVNLTNPASAFNTEYLYTIGVFSVLQSKYDDKYIFIPLDVARSLFNYETQVSAVELKLKPNVNVKKTGAKIESYLGKSYQVKDREQQQEDAYRVVRIEKWMTFLILVLILVIVIFNVIGSLSMLIIDKKEDVKTFRNLGADKSLIFKIFLFEGWIITGIGAIVGIIFGLILCFIQQHFGILRLGDGSSAFIINAYPVKIQFTDLLLVFVTISLLGLFTAWIPAKNAASLQIENE